MDQGLRNKIGLAFKREGFIVHGADTVDYILDELRKNKDDSEFLVRLLRAIDRQALRQNFVDLEAAKRAVGVITMDVSSKVEEESLRIVPAFSCPRVVYHEGRKTFLSDTAGSAQLFGAAEDFTKMHRTRFEMIRQRLLRHAMFANQKLTTVKSLLGVTGRRAVFGMLTRNSQGQLTLEDLNNTVVVNLDQARIDEGMYTDNCMVVADGELRHGVFYVHSLSMPPAEEASVTLSTFANVDFFGGLPDPALRNDLALYQKTAEHTMIVVFSDVWLDKPQVLAKLETVFDGYSSIVPTAFIFLGNFMSRPPRSSDDVQKVQQAFHGLTRLILKYKSLALQSTWIFSRGPSDPVGSATFPQAALPDFFVGPLKQRLPHVHFVTNPFRVRWCETRMVFFRENMMSKMRRHSLFPRMWNADESGAGQLLARTLIEQSTLLPLPLLVAPVSWNHSLALSLYPVPDLLVVADSFSRYVTQVHGCMAANPGSFGADFSFLVVRPSPDLEVEESCVDSAGQVEKMMQDEQQEEAVVGSDEEVIDEQREDELQPRDSPEMLAPMSE